MDYNGVLRFGGYFMIFSIWFSKFQIIFFNLLFAWAKPTLMTIKY